MLTAKATSIYLQLLPPPQSPQDQMEGGWSKGHIWRFWLPIEAHQIYQQPPGLGRAADQPLCRQKESQEFLSYSCFTAWQKPWIRVREEKWTGCREYEILLPLLCITILALLSFISYFLIFLWTLWQILFSCWCFLHMLHLSVGNSPASSTPFLSSLSD